MTESASAEIDAKIAAIDDWRGPVLARMRKLILDADPEIVQEIKWRKPSNPGGVPTYSKHGIICTADTFKDKVKITFGNGAQLEDPSHLFNASLGGNAMRAIDIREGEQVDAEAFKALIRAAVAANEAKRSAG
jgi:hypothetical protein